MDWITRHNDSLTLRELVEGNSTIVFQCQKCGHSTQLDLRELMQRHGGETRVAFIKRNAKCASCD